MKESNYLKQLLSLSSVRELGILDIRADVPMLGYFCYVVGMFDRRGTFHISKNPNQLSSSSAVVSLQKHNKYSLENVQKLFSFGKNTLVGRIEYRERNDCFVLIIDDIEDIKNRIIPFFSKFRLDTKSKQFRRFRDYVMKNYDK